MGLLDDAIREHLELKRRHGADPDELARAEREALGPVRRERFESQEAGRGGEARIDERRGAGLAEPEHDFVDEDSNLRLRDDVGRHGLSEAEYEEYYDEEYYDDEVGEWEEPSHEAAGDAAYGAQSLGEEAGTGEIAPTGGRQEQVPPESAPPTQATPPEKSEPVAEGEETVEYSVEEAVRSQSHHPGSAAESAAGSAEADSEDMLEETPEFLQDAPEHDRLWFEQRPPRDFDFDG